MGFICHLQTLEIVIVHSGWQQGELPPTLTTPCERQNMHIPKPIDEQHPCSCSVPESYEGQTSLLLSAETTNFLSYVLILMILICVTTLIALIRSQ